MIGSTRNEQRWLDRVEAKREYLQHLERTLQQELGQINAAADHPAATEDRNRADLVTNQALLGTLAESFAQIWRALERLEDGVYGSCEDCGRPIEEERLRCRPESTRCLACQRTHEQFRHRLC